MESCYLPSAICGLSVYAYLTFSFAVLAPLAIARLKQVNRRRRDRTGGSMVVGVLHLA